MGPSYLLIGLILAGAVGAIVLTTLAMWLLSATIECSACESRQSKRSRFCQTCGVPMAQRQIESHAPPRPGSGRPTLSTDDKGSENGTLRRLAEAIAELTPSEREALWHLLRERNIWLAWPDNEPTQVMPAYHEVDSLDHTKIHSYSGGESQ